jgi:hypothetical protein
MGRHAITETIQMFPLEMVPKIQELVFSVKEVFHKDIPIISSSASEHYRILGLCREQAPLGTGPNTLSTACAERELSAEAKRHGWAGTEPSAESQRESSRERCAVR